MAFKCNQTIVTILKAIGERLPKFADFLYGWSNTVIPRDTIIFEKSESLKTKRKSGPSDGGAAPPLSYFYILLQKT